MLHIRYSARFWIWFDFEIYQTRIVNILGFWIKIYSVFEYALDSEYAKVLKIYGYTWFWVKFSIIDIWHCSEYASSPDHGSFTHGSVENSLSCMFDRVMSIPGVLIMLGPEDTKTVNMSLLHMILFKLCFEDSWCFECLEF